MPDALFAVQLLVGAGLLYLVLSTAHAVIGVLLRLADDLIHFLMKVFCVKTSRRK